VPRIYTRTGDDGTTGLLYGGRVSKGSALTEASGSVDEAVAALGAARALLTGSEPDLADLVLRLQRELFVVGADLATNPDQRHRLEAGVSLVTPEMVTGLEALIDEEVQAHPLPQAFVVPGATPASASLDLARTSVRRAERRVVALLEAGGTVSDEVRRYLNRLSDLLFVLARRVAGPGDVPSRVV
jgi:cob(I)alamin adenosyltransferase